MHETDSGLATASVAFDSAIGAEILSYTIQKIDIPYKMGARTTVSGAIDCSGWSGELMLRVMKYINREHDFEIYDIDKLKPMLTPAAAPQIEMIGDRAGFIEEQNIYNGNMLSGTFIGVRRQNGGTWAANRWNRISHIGVFFKVNGRSYISESADPYGVRLLPFSEWLKHEIDLGSRFYAANPCEIVKWDVRFYHRPSENKMEYVLGKLTL